MWYNINEIRRTDRRLAPKSIVKEITAQFGRQGGYFFLCIMEITKVMIETIKIPKVNKSFTVMYSIGNAPFRGLYFNRLPFRLPLWAITRRYYFTIFIKACQLLMYGRALPVRFALMLDISAFCVIYLIC